MTKILIDRDDCISCGLCSETCPEVFGENPKDGFAQIIERYRNGEDPGQGEVPDDLAGCAQEAADNCPVEIIHLGDKNSG